MTIVEAPAEQHEPLDHPTNTNVVLVGQVLCILVPFVIWFMPLDVLAQHVLAWMQPFLGNIVLTTIVMYWTAFAYHFLLASEISMLGTSIPLIMEFAKSSGFNPLQLGLIWTFAAGGKLFAYQSGVLIVGYSYGYFEARDLVRIGAWLTVVEFVVLVLLVPFYWPLIGIH
jgi:di/tricarboxylate transporter